MISASYRESHNITEIQPHSTDVYISRTERIIHCVYKGKSTTNQCDFINILDVELHLLFLPSHRSIVPLYPVNTSTEIILKLS